MKKYNYLNTALFRNGAVQVYHVFDTETREIYYLGILTGKSKRGSVSFKGTRKAVNRWRQSLGSS